MKMALNYELQVGAARYTGVGERERANVSFAIPESLNTSMDFGKRPEKLHHVLIVAAKGLWSNGWRFLSKELLQHRIVHLLRGLELGGNEWDYRINRSLYELLRVRPQLHG
jgi:hypothetical protein